MKKLKLAYNMAKSIYNYKVRKTDLNNSPLMLWIEPTNICNLKCIMCPNKDIPKEIQGFMEWDVYKKIIDEIQGYVSSVYLLLAGESFLHKDIFKMIGYANNKGVRVLMNTNGTTLSNPLNRRKLIKSGVSHITFALDGYNTESYEKIRVGGQFEKVIGGIVEFLKEKKKRGLTEPYVAIATLLVGVEEYEDQEAARREFKGYFKGLPVDEFIVKTPNTWGGTFADTEEFNHHSIEKDNFYPCSHLWSTLSIMWDGTVVPCCFDFFKTYVLGNVKEKSIIEIWNDLPMKKLRGAMLNDEYNSVNRLCKNCVILHLETVLGIPAGMRTTVKDTITSIVGLKSEKYLIKFAKKIKSGYSLQIDD